MKMKKVLIRTFLASVLPFLLLPQTAMRSSAKERSNDEQIIRLSASTFEFKPNEITVKKGVPVTVELVSEDRKHGFKLAGFSVRTSRPAVLKRYDSLPTRPAPSPFSAMSFAVMAMKKCLERSR
jgi:hypothetical protein